MGEQDSPHRAQGRTAAAFERPRAVDSPWPYRGLLCEDVWWRWRKLGPTTNHDCALTMRTSLYSRPLARPVLRNRVLWPDTPTRGVTHSAPPTTKNAYVIGL